MTGWFIVLPEWMERASCGDYDEPWWFPEKGDSDSEKRAKRICRRCPVRDECLAYALDTRQKFWIWGGMTAKERERLLKGKV